MLWAGVLAAWILLPGIIGDWQESPTRWIPILCYATTIQFLVQLWSWRTVSGSLFDPYLVFLTAATLFNAGRALLASLPDSSLESPFSPSIALYGLYVVALSLCSFHLGGLLAIASTGARPSRARASLAIPNATLRYVGGWLVLVAIVPMSILMKQAVAGVMRDGYGVALYTNEAATSFAATPSVLAAFLVPGAFLLLAGGAKEDRIESYNRHYCGRILGIALVYRLEGCRDLGCDRVHLALASMCEGYSAGSDPVARCITAGYHAGDRGNA